MRAWGWRPVWRWRWPSSRWPSRPMPGTRSELRSQVDNSLHGLRPADPPTAAPTRTERAGARTGIRAPAGPPARAPWGVTNTELRSRVGVDRGPTFGAAAGVKGFHRPERRRVHGPPATRARSPWTRGSPRARPEPARPVLHRCDGRRPPSARAGHRHTRPRSLVVALPLQNVDQALSSQLLLLILIAAAGIALAALLGILVARTALAPIARFTRRAEQIAANPERHNLRLEEEGGDELGRSGGDLQCHARRAGALGSVTAQPRCRCFARAPYADRHPAGEPAAHARREPSERGGP